MITPSEFTNPIISESRRIFKKIYKKDIDGVYYRVKTAQYKGHIRRMYLKGNGEILEFIHIPHITLIGGIEITEKKLPDLINNLKKNLANRKKFVLNPLGIGDYDQAFTFYIEFEQNPILTSILKESLIVTEKYLPNKKYKTHKLKTFVPHTTILYDDIDPEKVKAAEEMLNKDLLKHSIHVNELELWGLESHKLINSIKISLS